MKKILCLLVMMTIIATMFVACNSTDTEPNAEPIEKAYNLAIGVAVTPSTANAKITETVAAVVTDADGKLVLCRFECIEYAVKVGDDGELVKTAPVGKAAQGDAYDAYSPMAAGTWYKQADALAKSFEGKTQAEIADTANTNGYLDDAELKASCSINVNDMLVAVDNAFKSEFKTEFKSTADTFSAGVVALGAVEDKSTETEGNVKFTVDFAASVLENGKVVASILDSTEVTLKNVTAEEGVFSAAEAEFKGTKRTQGTAYDAYSPMAAGTWYVQADAYAAAANGKTVDDIATLATEGVAGCTIYAGGYKQAIENAVKAAK